MKSMERRLDIQQEKHAASIAKHEGTPMETTVGFDVSSSPKVGEKTKHTKQAKSSKRYCSLNGRSFEC